MEVRQQCALLQDHFNKECQCLTSLQTDFSVSVIPGVTHTGVEAGVPRVFYTAGITITIIQNVAASRYTRTTVS